MHKTLETNLPCPKCPSSDAYVLYDDGGYCFSCGYKEKEEEIITETEFTTEYLSWRAIPKEIMKFYDIKTRINGKGVPYEIAIPYGRSTLLRKLDKKDFKWEGSGYDHSLFGQEKFDPSSSKEIYVTEAALDAASIYSIIKRPAVGCFNTSSARSTCEKHRDYLNSFENIYLVFDNDEPGQKAAELIASIFDPTKIFIVKMVKHKDANEYLQANESNDLRVIIQNTQSYKPTNIISSFKDIRSALEQPSAKTIATYPFPTLQEMTYGIREGERILITAPEGVGKTEVLRAMEYHVLQTTDINIGTIHLEESKTRQIKGIAGYSLRLPVHLHEGFSADNILNAFTDAVKREDRLHIYTHFGTDDPRLIIDTIRRLVTVHNCKIVFFDHITMAVTGLAEEDERKALDQISTQLAMLTEQLQFAIIFVSHVNDFGQTRGSRYPSKICDVRINLRRDLLSDDPIIKNTTFMEISKNRFSGLTGQSSQLYFDRETFTISEQEGDFGIPREN